MRRGDSLGRAHERQALLGTTLVRHESDRRHALGQVARRHRRGLIAGAVRAAAPEQELGLARTRRAAIAPLAERLRDGAADRALLHLGRRSPPLAAGEVFEDAHVVRRSYAARQRGGHDEHSDRRLRRSYPVPRPPAQSYLPTSAPSRSCCAGGLFLRAAHLCQRRSPALQNLQNCPDAAFAAAQHHLPRPAARHLMPVVNHAAAPDEPIERGGRGSSARRAPSTTRCGPGLIPGVDQRGGGRWSFGCTSVELRQPRLERSARQSDRGRADAGPGVVARWGARHGRQGGTPSSWFAREGGGAVHSRSGTMRPGRAPAIRPGSYRWCWPLAPSKSCCRGVARPAAVILPPRRRRLLSEVLRG